MENDDYLSKLGFTTLQMGLTPVIWNASIPHKYLLEMALADTIEEKGSVDSFVQEVGISVEDLASCDWKENLPSPECLKKIYPHILPALRIRYDECILEMAKEELRKLYDKYNLDGINTDEEFKIALENLDKGFQGFSESERVKAFTDYLNSLHACYLEI